LGVSLPHLPQDQINVCMNCRPGSSYCKHFELAILKESASAVARARPGPARARLEEAGLASQKWPEEIHPVDDFPRAPSGKVQKYLVRQDSAARSSAARSPRLDCRPSAVLPP
jgi:acyl-CoA synthetase (AMP-forming)/AMP-acid ligase II